MREDKVNHSNEKLRGKFETFFRLRFGKYVAMADRALMWDISNNRYFDTQTESEWTGYAAGYLACKEEAAKLCDQAIASNAVMLPAHENEEARRQCVLAIADQLKRWSELNPTAREKFEIAAITSVFGWNPEMYVDMGFDRPPVKSKE